jgi:capsule biosynthesis phosphatase
MKIIIDLDDTITIDTSDRDYSNKHVNKDVVAALRQAKRQGYSVHIFTARNIRTYENDLEAIHKHTKPIAEEWLRRNDVPYDELTFGKPWCEKGGFYVDDKLVSIDEFVFKFLGPFESKTFDIVVPFYNEQDNVARTHKELKKLERLLNINRYIYIQNGSEDDTAARLIALSKNDSKIYIEHIDINKGYGHGFQKGFKASNADYILTNHSDCQFDAYAFFITHMEEFLNQKTVDAIFPKRLNRPNISVLRTKILQKILQVLIGKTEIKDFNGQPKIFCRRYIPSSLPNDFCLDLAIFLEFQKPNFNSISLPIIEKERHKGISSWVGSKKKQFAIIWRYISYAYTQKRL